MRDWGWPAEVGLRVVFFLRGEAAVEMRVGSVGSEDCKRGRLFLFFFFNRNDGELT